MIIPLGFLLIGGTFVISLVKSIIGLIDVQWNNENPTVREVVNHFAIPILSLIIFILFLILLPYLE